MSNTRDHEIDRGLLFEKSSGIDSLVNETFDNAESVANQDIYQKSGRLNAPILVKNAKILLSSGDTKLAKQIFRSLIEQGEMLGVAYAGLGAAFEMENKAELAIKCYREAIIYDPSYGALLALAELFLQQRDFNAAVGTLLRAQSLRLSPAQHFEIHKSLGNCYMHMGQLNNAEIHYRKAYDLRSDSDALHVNIGSLAMRKSDPATALLHFKEALRLNAQSSRAQSGIGLAQMAMGQHELAHDSFCAALRLDSQDAASLTNLIRCAYELKRFDTAGAEIQEYMKRNPVNSNLIYCLAGILYHQKKYGQAAEECDKLLAFNPEHAGAEKLKRLIQEKLQG